MRAFGVDEAGKGPVLGPMVAACIVADPASIPRDVDDSKRLSAAQRDRLAAILRDRADVDVGLASISVDRIDDPRTDMNSLTVEAHAQAVVDARVEGLPGVLDAGEIDARRFGRRVADACGDSPRSLTAAHGADADCPLVGAASIVAKVERDRAVEALATRHGAIGSGYPSDPQTRAFLRRYVEDHGSLPDCARRSWQTSQDVLAAARQGTLAEF